MNRPNPPRRQLSALAAVLLASTGVAFTAQSASADGGRKVVRVQDRCDQPTWDQDPFHELNGLCNPDPRACLAADGGTVFLCSHLMSEMSQTADHLLVIGRDRIISAAPVQQVIASDAGDAVRVRSPRR